MATAPARNLLPALAAADAALAAHGTLVPSPSATLAEYMTWSAERDRLAAAVDAAATAVRGLLCGRCGGTGRTQWRHRSGGTCYQCNGDGWTAKGRRQHTVTV